MGEGGGWRWNVDVRSSVHKLQPFDLLPQTLFGVPPLEFAHAGFAHYDAARGLDAEGDGQLRYGPDADFLHGVLGYDVLAVGPEEEVGVELVHDGVERAVHGLLVAVVEDGARHLVFQVEAGHLAYLDGYQLVVDGYEEVGLITAQVGCQSVDVGALHGGAEAFQLVDGVLQVLGGDGLEQVVDAAGLEGVEGVLVVGRGEDERAFDVDLVEDMERQAVGQVYVHEAEVGLGAVGRFEILHALLYALERWQHGGVGHDAEQQAAQVFGGDGFVFDDEYGSHGGGIDVFIGYCLFLDEGYVYREAVARAVDVDMLVVEHLVALVEVGEADALRGVLVGLGLQLVGYAQAVGRGGLDGDAEGASRGDYVVLDGVLHQQLQADGGQPAAEQRGVDALLDAQRLAIAYLHHVDVGIASAGCSGRWWPAAAGTCGRGCRRSL